MAGDFDLLGDPIPEGFGKRGRPPHRVTDEKRKLVISLQAFGWTIEKIAAALSITAPTLRKNYFRELKAKAEARARVEAAALNALVTEAQAGNVSAIDKLLKRFDKIDLKALADSAANRSAEPEQRRERLGKKEQQRQAASEVEGIFAPPAPPSRLN